MDKNLLWIPVAVLLLVILQLVNKPKTKTKKKDTRSSFQDYGFEYFNSFDTDILVAKYALSIKDSILFSYGSLAHGVAYQKKETTPKYGIPNGQHIFLDVYQLKERNDSIRIYEQIKDYKLVGRDIIREAFDPKIVELKFMKKDSLIFGHDVQSKDGSKVYHMEIETMDAPRSIGTILKRVDH